MLINYLNFEHLYQLPCLIYLKDIKGNYLGSNDYPAINLGAPRGSDMIGLTDFDLCYSEYAKKFQDDDKRVIMQEKAINTVEMGNFLGTDIHYLVQTYKQPVCNIKGNTSAVLGMSFLINPSNNFNFDTLDGNDSKNFQQTKKIDYENYNLTPRQEDCLFLLIKGRTAKEIAKELNLSVRTVEHHLTALKIKLNSNTRSDLITKALTVLTIKAKLLKYIFT